MSWLESLGTISGAAVAALGVAAAMVKRGEKRDAIEERTERSATKAHRDAHDTTAKILLAERQGREGCEERLAAFRIEVDERDEKRVGEIRDLSVQLARCEERHDAMEERMTRLERRSSPPKEVTP